MLRSDGLEAIRTKSRMKTSGEKPTYRTNDNVRSPERDD